MGPELLAYNISSYIKRKISACISSELIIDDFKSFEKRKVLL